MGLARQDSVDYRQDARKAGQGGSTLREASTRVNHLETRREYVDIILPCGQAELSVSGQLSTVTTLHDSVIYVEKLCVLCVLHADLKQGC